MEAAHNLTNLQLELLKMFKYELSDNQMMEIKQLLAKYFASKASDEMDRLWEENEWTNDTMDDWTQERLRTKYE